jgi:hypothetical protein
MRHLAIAALAFAALCGCADKPDKVVEFKYRQDFSLTKPIRCSYRENQSMTNIAFQRVALRQKPNSKAVVWEFRDLFKRLALASVGVQTAEAVPYATGNGVSLILPQGNGVHLFTVWGSGVSIWTKHDTIQGLFGANQFLGVCENF